MPTSTIGSTGDHLTVAAWEAATDNDLSGVGIEIGEIIEALSTTAVLTIAGATGLDSTHYRELTVNSAHRHAGVWDTGKQNFQVSSTNIVITIDEAFGRLSYIQAKNTHATNGGGGIFKIGNVTGCQINQCLGWYTAPAGTDDAAVFYVNGAGATNFVIRNCIGYAGRHGVYVSNASATGGVIQNSTFVGNVVSGVKAVVSVTMTLTNVYCGGNATRDYDQAGSANYAYTTVTCMASDTNSTESGLTNSIAYSTSNFTNVTAGSVDVHLVTGSALIDAGTDLSGSFTVDIDGVARSGTWDVGADEFVAGGGGGTSHRPSTRMFSGLGR